MGLDVVFVLWRGGGVPSGFFRGTLYKIYKPFIFAKVYDGERNSEGIRHGNGVNKFPNGDVYSGQYENGKRHGKGVYIWANNNKYEGEYEEGKKQGTGILTYSSGGFYNGKPLTNNNLMATHNSYTILRGMGCRTKAW